MPIVKMVTIRRTFMKYVTAAPTMKYPVLAFQEIGICCKNSKATAVKIRKLSIPAQGQAIANLAVPNGPVACRVGMPFSVPIEVVHPIKFKTPSGKRGGCWNQNLKWSKLPVRKNVIDSV